MSKAFLYFLAAGAFGVGGPAIAVILGQLGQQEAAAHTLTQQTKSFARLLRSEINLAALREKALATGVNPDLVEQAFREMRDKPGSG